MDSLKCNFIGIINSIKMFPLFKFRKVFKIAYLCYNLKIVLLVHLLWSFMHIIYFDEIFLSYIA